MEKNRTPLCYVARLAFFASVLVALSSCGGGGGDGGTQSPGPASLGISPTSVVVGVSTHTQFSASGGTAPYTFAVITGPGTIDTTGRYSAPPAPNSAVVRVTDSQGATTTANVTINPALSVSPSVITMTAASATSYPFTARDGATGYQYLVRGPGSISPTGIYTVGDTAGEATIEIRDQQGSLVTAIVNVVRIRTNGSVRAAATDNTSWYLGGDFDSVNPYAAPGMIAIDGTTGDPQLACDIRNGFDGAVRAIATDGSSIYAAGEFNHYRGLPANRVAKLDATTCQLDSTFAQSAGPDGTVYAIAIVGASVFIGGEFVEYRGTTAEFIAKLNAQTGAIDNVFASAVSLNGPVRSLAVSGNSLFAAGEFGPYNGNSAASLIKLNASDGALDPIFSQVGGFDGYAKSMAVDGNFLYVTGDLYTYRGTEIGRIAKINIATGALDTAFSRPIGFDQPTSAIAVSSNGVFVSGGFSTYRGRAVGLLVKLNKTTGGLDATFPSTLAFDSAIDSLAVINNQLFAGGLFGSINGVRARSFAQLDANTGALNTTFTHTTGFDQTPFLAQRSVYTLTTTGNTVLVGGNFNAYRGTFANHLAKVNMATNVPDSTFNQGNGANKPVHAILLSGSAAYVAGSFDRYRDQAYGNVVKVSAATGAVDTAFNQGEGVNGSAVVSMMLNGSALYMGGYFSLYRGELQPWIVKVDALTGARDVSFQPSFNYGDAVNAIQMSGNEIVLGTSGLPAIAKVNSSTGVASATFSNNQPNAPILSIAAENQTIYLGGGFGGYGNGVSWVNAIGLVKVDATTGLWDPNFTEATTFEGSVFATDTGPTGINSVALDGNFLYAAGSFALYRGAAANSVIKLNKDTGAADPAFSSANGPNLFVKKIIPTSNAVWISGDFTSYRNKAAYYFVPLNTNTGELLDP